MDERTKTAYEFLPTLPRRARGGTVQRIQDLIRNAIVHLDLPPGTFIDKAAICARLEVSRFPVSEALGRLASEGLVEVLPQRGTRVARIDIDDCRQAMFIRRALEAEAVRVIATRIDSRGLALIERNFQEQLAAREDPARFHELDLAFHELLLRELGYERVKSAVDSARASLDRMRLFLTSMRPRQDAILGEHRAVVDALMRHDPVAAGRAMEHHLDVVMTELAASASQHPQAFLQNHPGNTAAA